ncbi:MAG TPA: hypothetical protein VMH28_15600 [Candidatus Acidoferrales bacterium]|nr:hypothetical protein [Candidatus Acidoferrales bacterium]
MSMRLIFVMLLAASCGPHRISAQSIDPKVALELMAVRGEVARNNDALRPYTWTEHTEVSVDGSVKSSTAFLCRYDASGELTRTPLGDPKDEKTPNPVSKRHSVRAKAGMQDYIDRAISRIRVYVPPKPESMQYLLQNGGVSLGQAEAGKSQLRFTHYFEAGDSLLFTYDTATKALLYAAIASTLGSPKDPVTLDVVWATLPDGINHVASTLLKAKRKNVQVKTWNDTYQKVAN